MRTLRTLARSIARVNRDNGNSMQSRLVFDLRSQIEERPVIQLVTLTFTNRYPVSDIAQIFKSNSPTGVFSLHHKLFGNNVVLKFLEALLFTRKLFKFSFCGLGLLSLQIASAVRKGLTNAFNVLAGKLFTVRVGNDIYDAEIDTKNILRIKKFGFVNVADTVKKKLFSDIKKLYFALSVLKQLSLFITHHERNSNSTIDRPDGNKIVLFEAHYPVVVGDGAKRPELPLGLGVELVRVGNFSDGSDDDLSRQIERIPNGAIREFVKVELFEYLIFERFFRNPVTRFVDLLHGLKQRCGLAIERFKFEVNRQFHKNIITHYSNMEDWTHPIREMPHVSYCGLPTLR